MTCQTIKQHTMETLASIKTTKKMRIGSGYSEQPITYHFKETRHGFKKTWTNFQGYYSETIYKDREAWLKAHKRLSND